MSSTILESPKTARPVLRNPKDDMRSTWRGWDRSKWNYNHWLIEKLGLQPTDDKKEVPVHAKTDKMPYLPHSEGHKWVIAHACWPILLHQLYITATGKSMNPIAVFLLYTLAYKINAIHELNQLRGLGHKYGFLDGDKHERDQVPDVSVSSVMHSLTATSTFRPMMTTFLAYRRSQGPSTMSLWLPVEIGLYGIILDFWFYWYHRCMHEYDGLWKFHRTHHLTKHPNPLLTLFADNEQEVFDIAVIPLLTWGSMKMMGFPMGFYDWWMCHQYIVMTELWGHSGLRIRVTPATTATPFLKLFNGELTTEDHDLHHRKGYRKSHNYGKQTFLWDRIFGTCHERIEMADENIDWNNPVSLPIW